MNTVTRWTSLCGAFAIVVAMAAGEARGSDADLEKRFALLDEDGDGAVTRVEFRLNRTQVFYYTLLDSGFTLDSGKDDQYITAENSPLKPEVFASADVDGDGRLSGSEFVQAPFMQFEAFDANQDDVITLDEFLAAAREIVIDR